MSDKSGTKVYGIPGDLPRLWALGRIRRGRWPAKAIAPRLDYMDAYIAEGVVPDARGRRERSKDGRAWYRTVNVPPDLSTHMADLAEAVAACRALLDAGDVAAAGARMDGIEALVADMVRRATPTSERQREAAAKGGKARRGKLKPDTLAILAYVDAGHSYGQAARKFGRNFEAVKKLVQRHRK